MSLMDQKLSRAERKSRELKERVYVAAISLFAQRDFNDATMFEIAEAADVARSTLFNHYPNKIAFLQEFYLRFVRNVVENALATKTVGFRARIEAIDRAFGDAAAANKPIVHHLASLAMGHGPLAQTESEADEMLIRYFLDAVIEGQQAGELRTDRGASDIADLLLGLLTVTAHDWVNLRMTHDLGDLMFDRMVLATEGLASR